MEQKSKNSGVCAFRRTLKCLKTDSAQRLEYSKIYSNTEATPIKSNRKSLPIPPKTVSAEMCLLSIFRACNSITVYRSCQKKFLRGGLESQLILCVFSQCLCAGFLFCPSSIQTYRYRFQVLAKGALPRPLCCPITCPVLLYFSRFWCFARVLKNNKRSGRINVESLQNPFKILSPCSVFQRFKSFCVYVHISNHFFALSSSSQSRIASFFSVCANQSGIQHSYTTHT